MSIFNFHNKLFFLFLNFLKLTYFNQCSNFKESKITTLYAENAKHHDHVITLVLTPLSKKIKDRNVPTNGKSVRLFQRDQQNSLTL